MTSDCLIQRIYNGVKIHRYFDKIYKCTTISSQKYSIYDECHQTKPKLYEYIHIICKVYLLLDIYGQNGSHINNKLPLHSLSYILAPQLLPSYALTPIPHITACCICVAVQICQMQNNQSCTRQVMPQS